MLMGSSYFVKTVKAQVASRSGKRLVITLWTHRGLFQTTPFPISRGKYGSITLLLGILAVFDEMVKESWCYLHFVNQKYLFLLGYYC